MHSEHTQHLLRSLSDKHQIMTYVSRFVIAGLLTVSFIVTRVINEIDLRDRSRFLIYTMHFEQRRKLLKEYAKHASITKVHPYIITIINADVVRQCPISIVAVKHFNYFYLQDLSRGFEFE